MDSLSVGVCFDPAVLTQSRYSTSLASLDALVFPELVDGGYAALSRGAALHCPDDSLVNAFKQASRTRSSLIVAGTMSFAAHSGKPTNTSLIFHRGRLIFRYDKIHLFGPTGDLAFFQSGKQTGTFAWAVRRSRIRAGVAICYDIRFPELMRTMSLQGLQILFVPARWPVKRDDAWRTLLKARAIENQIFVVGCNALGKEGGISYAFDPLGKEIFSTRNQRSKLFHVFRAKLDLIGQSKTMHHNLRDARFLRSHLTVSADPR